MQTRKSCSVDLDHGPLGASASGRFLVHRDGTPFFYLGDTAWELFHRLSRQEVDLYLSDRASKRFTVIQAVALSEINGLTTPNAYGDLPLVDLDPTRPNEPYFRHVDYVFDKVAELGLFIGLLPTWGSYTVREKHPLFKDHPLFNPQNAHQYGLFLGRRYGRRPNVIWILGGDRMPTGYEETWRALARGLAEGAWGSADYSRTVMTYHPWGGRSSGEFFHNEPWLTFNMLQSGHHRDSAPYQMIAADYARTPAKPVINGEPGYERIPDGLKRGNPKLDDRDVRRFAYWSVFAGACGHTYGANEIWMMWKPELEPLTPAVSPLLDADTPWHQAIHYPGAGQMQHLRALMESRPMPSRMPDQSLLASGQGEGLRHVQATRASDGAYAMIYIPSPRQTVEVRLDLLSGSRTTAWWYDPRTGAAHLLERDMHNKRTRSFTSPEEGPDWVLVLDDVERGFGPPGEPTQ